MKGDREKCIEAGASDYITKPVDTDQLLSLLRVWLYRVTERSSRPRSASTRARTLEEHRDRAAARGRSTAATASTSASTRRRRCGGGSGGALHAEGLETISALQERVLHDPACMERLLLDLSINVTSMFRDPTFYLGVPGEGRAAAADLPVHRASGSPAARPARRSTRWRSCSRRRGCYERTRIYATDINEAVLERRAAGRLPARARCRSTRRTTSSAGGERGVLRVLHRRRYDGALFDALAAEQHRLRAAQPGLRPRLQRVQRDPLPQRDDLLRPLAAGSRPRALPRQPGAFGVLALGHKESMRFTPFEQRLRGARRRRAALQEGRMRRAHDAGRDRRLRGRGSRRCRASARALPRRSDAAGRRRPAPQRADSSSGGAGRPAAHRARRCPSPRPTTRTSIEPGHVYLAPPDYHLLVERGHARALDRRAACTSRGPRSTCSSSPRPTRTASACIGVVLTGANADGAAGLARDQGAAAGSRSSRTRLTRRAPRDAGARRSPRTAADAVLAVERDRPVALRPPVPAGRRADRRLRSGGS